MAGPRAVYIDIRDVVKKIENMGRRFRPAVLNVAYSRAINRTLQTARAKASSEIRRSYKIKKADLDPRLKVHKASRGKLEGRLTAWGTPIPIKEFKPTVRRRGISVNITGRRQYIKGAFWQTRKKSGRGIFARGKYETTGFVPSADRYPISTLVTVSQGVMMGNPSVLEPVIETVDDMLGRRIKHEVNFLLAGLAK